MHRYNNTPHAYVYMGTCSDGTAAVGVIGSIDPDGSAELWERLPNLGMTCHVVNAKTLTRIRPLHILPQPPTSEQYNEILDALTDYVNTSMREHITSSDVLRRIASRIEFLADYVDYVQPTQSDTDEEETQP